MSEYENNQQVQQMPQQFQQPGYVIAGNSEICTEIKANMSSNMMFAAAIITAVQIFCLLLAGIIENVFGVMLALSIPFIISAVEIWVTFGTARWAKGGPKIGGIVTGKVFSIINIVFTGVVILFYFIGAVAWSIMAAFIGEVLDELMREVLGFGDVYGDIASISNGVVFLTFFISMIPLVLNIVLQAQLNTFRNRCIEAVEGKLTKRPKTMGIAVIMFIVGLPLLIAAVILLWAGLNSGFSTALIGLAYTLAAAMYYYGGVLLIKCGKGR